MTDLAPKYNPTEVEAGRYEQWLEEGVFKPSGDKKAKPYSIVIPPPNVTGKLHLGHAWDTTIQDTLIRMKRMQGYDTLYLPGMDHAGIATQAKVEAKMRAEGKNRHEMGRKKNLWNRSGRGRTSMPHSLNHNGLSSDCHLTTSGSVSHLMMDFQRPCGRFSSNSITKD